MRANGGMFGTTQFVQYVNHLLRRQPIVRFDRGVTSSRGRHPAQCLINGTAAIQALEVLSQGTARRLSPPNGNQSRHSRYLNTPSTELIDLESKTGQYIPVSRKSLAGRRGQLQHHRN